MRSTHRLITFLAAVLLGLAAFQPWLSDVLPAHYPAVDLLAGNSGTAPPNFYVSFGMVLLVAAVVALMAVVIGPRDLAWVAFVLALVGGLLYVLRHPAAVQQFQLGFWLAAAASVLLLVGGLSGVRAVGGYRSRRTYD
ncbi:hypothetical protein R8Z50_00570 [Longispora sp. K20-0274]|uniref:hypothetical protein n=1 Tax=Longispora sp. K20-0274 TaxID=3088255 RepID=UPI00399BA31A